MVRQVSRPEPAPRFNPTPIADAARLQGISREELAVACGRSVWSIYRYFKRQSTPPHEVARHLARFVGVPLAACYSPPEDRP